MNPELDSFYEELLALHRKGAGTAVLDMLEMPQDLSGFLNRLSRPAERLSALAEQLGSSTGELSAVAYAFIRQRLFAPGNNHYQVLGLSEEASMAEIRQRYRLLIGLFHPDRVNRSENWVDRAVRMLNMSYAELKRPAKRKVYDTGLQTGGHSKPSRRHTTRPHSARRKHRPLAVSRHPSDALYRITPLQRHPKVFVWMTIVSVLVLIMLATMNGGQPVSLTPADSQTVARQLSDRVPGDLLLSGVPAPVLQEAASDIEKKDTASSQTSGTAKPEHITEPAVTAVEHDPVPVEPVVTIEAPSHRSESLSKAAISQASLVAGVTETTPSPVPFDGVMAPSAKPLPELSQWTTADTERNNTTSMQPEFVLMQYIRAWEKGDVDSLLRLFTLDSNANGRTGREQIGMGYRHMFETTGKRHFSLEELKILPVDGQGFRAWAQVAAQAESKADGSETHYRGYMVFDLVPKGRRLYIARLRHSIRAGEK